MLDSPDRRNFVDKDRALGRRAVMVGMGAGVLSPRAFSAGLKAASVVIDCDNGEVVHAYHAEALRQPASLAKVMTLRLLFESVAAGDVMLADEIVVSSLAASQPPVRLGLVSGGLFPVGEAALALTVRSANDVAVAVAEHIGGSEARFCALMNARARLLGLRRTRFVNASGLPSSGQVSTALDLARLGVSVRRDCAVFFDSFSRRRFEWEDRVYDGHTEIFSLSPGVVGAKTGYTSGSGYNLLAWSDRGDRRLLGVVLGGVSASSRDALMARLLDRAFTRL